MSPGMQHVSLEGKRIWCHDAFTMALDPQTKAKLEDLIRSDDVVLFMKGSRHFPQCGFSATVVQILDKLVPKYATVNVLADPSVREGIKEYSQWPTIPQLYVKGELVGGCDIVREMFASGDLQKKLGVPATVATAAPRLTVSASAIKAFEDAAGEMGEDVLRLEIDPQFQNDLFFGPKRPGDLLVRAGSFSFHVDEETAARADGVSIDFVNADGGSGFKITNPNAPPRVQPLTAQGLRTMKEQGQKLELFDVRPETERARAKIDWARAFDAEGEARLATLPKDTPVVFHCHHGIRSRRAAEEALRDGFTSVYNLEGGIDAWSQAVDPKVPRY
jgi:monothiol glutaredoxin